jgi:hypothetical protein
MIVAEQKDRYAQIISQILGPNYRHCPTPFDYPDELTNQNMLYYRFVGQKFDASTKADLLNRITSIDPTVYIQAELTHIVSIGKYIIVEISTLDDLEKEKQALQDKYNQDLKLLDEKIQKIQIT